MLIIANDGQKIVETNYFCSPLALNGFVFLSPNAGAVRLLLPKTREKDLRDMSTAKEVIISRGPWPFEGITDAVEVMFEDNSDEP